jgi:hypothetical protein
MQESDAAPTFFYGLVRLINSPISGRSRLTPSIKRCLCRPDNNAHAEVSMYFAEGFYSHEAWKAWSCDKQTAPLPRHDTTDYGASDRRSKWLDSITFGAVGSFAELAQRAAFLQLMNKRHVLYFRGLTRDFGSKIGYPALDLPSILRAPRDGTLTKHLLRRRLADLESQTAAWKQLLTAEHPRRRTLEHYPETIHAVQQHYKDLLPAHPDKSDDRRAQSLFLDVSASLRVAATFATARDRNDDEPALVFVIALPQTTGSITFDADQQLQIMRLAALCHPAALRPQLQEGFLVGRFPRPSNEQLESTVNDVKYHEEFFSLRRRVIAILKIRVNDGFWGKYCTMSSSALLSCPWYETLSPSWSKKGKLRFS